MQDTLSTNMDLVPDSVAPVVSILGATGAASRRAVSEASVGHSGGASKTKSTVKPSIPDSIPVAVSGRPIADSKQMAEGRLRAGIDRIGVYSGLLFSLRAKHAPTAAHCIRVAQSISAWGLFHRLPEKELELLELAGLLHDIGKIGIPERILQKPSPLTQEERAVMELHPQVGVEILRSSGCHPDVIEAVRMTGCWFDGSNRSEKVRLPLTQRILSIMDAFDAMTNDSPYRAAVSPVAALGELSRLAGRQFDSELVKSFVEVVSNANESLRRTVEDRWHGSGHAHSMVHLFQSNQASHQAANAAIESLNQVFHRQMMDHMNHGVIFIDMESVILEWNNAAQKLSGLKRSTILHSEWTPELIDLRDENNRPIEKKDCPILQAMQRGVKQSGRYSIQNRDGEEIFVDAQVMPIYDARSILRGGVMIFADVSDKMGLEEQVQELHARATQDPLTKVANRAELNRRLPEFVRACTEGTQVGSVLICDIDYFKRINDTFGHPAGDEALVKFAEILTNSTRSSDLVCRYGGEEFVILCEDCDLASAIDIGEQIREKLHNTPIDALKGRSITASFGVSAVLPNDDPFAAMERADKALLLAKQAGRDRVLHFEMDSNLDDSLSDSSRKDRSSSPSSWVDWFGLGKPEAVVNTEILMRVPRHVAIERLKGFTFEAKAKILNIKGDRVELKVDCRNVPMIRREGDRPAILTLTVVFDEVDVSAASRRELRSRSTKLELQILPIRSRDRRIENVRDQAVRLKAAFISFMSGEEIDEQLRDRIVPAYIPASGEVSEDGR